MTRKQKRLSLFAGAAAISAIAVGLVLTALNATVSYFYTPSDFIAEAAPSDRLVRLGGLVAAGSVKFDDSEETRVTFVIEDGAASVPVRFEGVLPDLFREGQGVVAQGRVAPDGGFIATQVLAKHDENYMPPEVAEALKEQGVWRDED